MPNCLGLKLSNDVNRFYVAAVLKKLILVLKCFSPSYDMKNKANVVYCFFLSLLLLLQTVLIATGHKVNALTKWPALPLILTFIPVKKMSLAAKASLFQMR